MTLDLRRTGAISVGLHAVLLLALLFSLPPKLPPATEDNAVTMEFALAPGQVQRAPTASPNPAPAPAEVPTPDLPSLQPPKPTPIQAPAPPPPPPLPPPQAPVAAPMPSPPIPPPLAQSSPPAPVTVAPAPTQAEIPLPPVPRPPTPTPAKPAPQPAPQAAPSPAKPAPTLPAARPAPERQTPTQRTNSTTNQQNPTKNTADDSRSLDATLDRLRSLQAQNQAPTHAYNPPRGGAPGGGSPSGVDNAKLSGADRGAIGDRIRECWTRDAGARAADKMSAVLQVVTDGSGTVRDVKIVQPGQGPGGLAFAERARRAALDPQCNPIPLPRALLGQTHTFEINFKP